MDEAKAALPPGSTIGILGGGQLGRMLALAAAELGFRVHIFAPDEDSPAALVAGAHTRAPYEDETALAAFAATVDAITYEFENVPARTAAVLAGLKPVRPGERALAVAQDRFDEKTFVNSLGIGTAPFARVDDAAGAAKAYAAIGRPAILKTRRMGYDGKGQAKVESVAEAQRAFASFDGAPCILEGYVDFEREISVVAARDLAGHVEAYDPVENEHANHILARTLAPAHIDARLASEAVRIAATILDALDYVGTMGVEMFVTRDGHVLVNEMAPRVHNSGHWTMDACEASQFEQHIRAVAGWPLRSAKRHSDAVMVNLIGDDADRWAEFAADKSANVHLYAKRQARPGRKMGHVTTLYPLGGRS